MVDWVKSKYHLGGRDYNFVGLALKRKTLLLAPPTLL